MYRDRDALPGGRGLLDSGGSAANNEAVPSALQAEAQWMLLEGLGSLALAVMPP